MTTDEEHDEHGRGSDEDADDERHVELSPEERTNVPTEDLVDVDDAHDEAVEEDEEQDQPGEHANTEKMNADALEETNHDNAPDEMPNDQQ